MVNSNYDSGVNKGTLPDFTSILKWYIENHNAPGSSKSLCDIAKSHGMTFEQVKKGITKTWASLNKPGMVDPVLFDSISDEFKPDGKHRKRTPHRNENTTGSLEKHEMPENETPEEIYDVQVEESQVHLLIKDKLEDLGRSNYVFRPINTDKTRLIVADPESKSIYFISLRVYKSDEGEELSVVNEDTIIDAFFDNVKVSFQEIPGIPGLPRKVEFDAVSDLQNSPLHIGPCTDKEALQKLDQHGLILNQNRAPDCFKSVIQAYLFSGRASRDNDAGVSGFFLDVPTGKIMAFGYQTHPVAKEELRKALEKNNEIAKKFPLERYGSFEKWCIISPFFYPLKQKGIYPRHYVMLGPTGTQKTALGRIAPAIWGLFDIPSQDHGHFISGSRTDTPYRLGKSIGKSTFPALVDEPKGLFSKDVNIELLKTATQNLVARETSDGIYPALNSLVLLTNVTLENAEDILASRFDIVRTTLRDQIHFSIREKEEFQKFQAETYPELEPIGQYVASKIMANPDLLTADYEKLGTALLEEMYRFAELPVPDFVYVSACVDTVEDINIITLEQIRSFLARTNMEAFSRNYGRVGILAVNSNGGEYPQYDSMTNVSAEERITHSIKGGLIPWQIYKDTTGIEQVIFTTAFAKEVSRIVGEAYNLQSIGELLGFEYKVSRIGPSSGMTLVTPLDDYLKFLNPEIEDREPGGSHQIETGEIRKQLRSLNSKSPEQPGDAST